MLNKLALKCQDGLCKQLAFTNGERNIPGEVWIGERAVGKGGVIVPDSVLRNDKQALRDAGQLLQRVEITGDERRFGFKNRMPAGADKVTRDLIIRAEHDERLTAELIHWDVILPEERMTGRNAEKDLLFI